MKFYSKFIKLALIGTSLLGFIVFSSLFAGRVYHYDRTNSYWSGRFNRWPDYYAYYGTPYYGSNYYYSYPLNSTYYYSYPSYYKNYVYPSYPYNGTYYIDNYPTYVRRYSTPYYRRQSVVQFSTSTSERTPIPKSSAGVFFNN